MSGVLRLAWVLAWIAAGLAVVLGLAIIFHAQLGSPFAEGLRASSAKDVQDWEWFQSLPLGIRLCILPYFGGIITLVILIIGKSKGLFANFRDELVFDRANVEAIRDISRLVIGLSILSFSIGSFLVGVILFLFCEIVKSGTALKEEHDLTI
jgi:hypothetical protein